MKVFRTAEEHEAIQKLDEADRPPLEGVHEVCIVDKSVKDELDKICRKIESARKRATRQKKPKNDEANSLASSVRSAMELARQHSPDCTPLAAIRILSDAPFPGLLEAGSLASYFCRFAQAILDEDDELFTALARAVRGDVKPREIDKLVEYLQNAYFTLLQDETLSPTKKQVRDLALERNAVENVLHRPTQRRWVPRETIPSEKDADVRSEKESIYLRNSWPRLWKAAGLNSLKNDPGGGGQHRVRQSSKKGQRRTGKG